MRYFFTSSAVPLTPEGGTMEDEHADVRGAMVPPSGVRGIPVENIAINIYRNLRTCLGSRNLRLSDHDWHGLNVNTFFFQSPVGAK